MDSKDPIVIDELDPDGIDRDLDEKRGATPAVELEEQEFGAKDK